MAAKNTSVSLGEHFTAFLQKQVGEGRYNSTSDVVRAGLRLLEERETRLAALRQALSEGEESGDFAVVDFDAFIEERLSASAEK